MATRFELVLYGRDPVALRAAGEEAFREIEALEERLSIFRPASELSRVNLLAARQPVRLSAPVFELLTQAKRLWRETGGAFDLTIGPLLRAWGFLGGTGHWPDERELAHARTLTGMHLVLLDASERTVSFAQEGVMLDPGAIGKGYALDTAVDVLREAGVESALIHGGTSTVYGLGRPPQADHWAIAVQPPNPEAFGLRQDLKVLPQEALDSPSGLAVVPLMNQALSVSAITGKCFVHEGRTYGHILDPRTGHPAEHTVLAGLVVPSATDADALSTALLVGGPAQWAELARLRPGMSSLLVTQEGGTLRAQSTGIRLTDTAKTAGTAKKPV
jgi:thiamine biosynthesis lipoprotein